MADIIEELPKLSSAERLELHRHIIQLANEQEEMVLCETAAQETFVMLDRMEAEDEDRSNRS